MKKIFSLISLTIFMVGVAMILHAKDPAIGEPAPAFTLQDPEGKKHSLADYKGRYVVLEWINHGCPFVKKHYNSGNMQKLQQETQGKGAVWLSVCSSAEGKQGYYEAVDWPDVVEEKNSFPRAVLLDTDGKVGKLYGAKTTPHMYIVDPKGVLIYKGAIDDKPSTSVKDVPGAHNFVRAALDEALAGKRVSQPATKPYGCSVKYK